MTRRVTAAAIALVACAAAAGAAAVAPAGVAASPGSARSAAPAASTAVGVGEREYRITIYRHGVPRGEVRFNVTNRGEDTHNLVLLTPRGTQLAASPDIRSGGRHVLRARVRIVGTYTLVCTTADHAARGMITHLRVRAR